MDNIVEQVDSLKALYSQMNDYTRGRYDCSTGVPHEHKSNEYTRGYAYQYELEQKRSAK